MPCPSLYGELAGLEVLALEAVHQVELVAEVLAAGAVRLGWAVGSKFSPVAARAEAWGTWEQAHQLVAVETWVACREAVPVTTE